jgi:hypothetical protein
VHCMPRQLELELLEFFRNADRFAVLQL